MKTLKLSMLALLGTLIYAADSHAATDGDLGATSTGTSEISVTIPEYAQITGMADITVASYNGDPGGIDEDEDVCVYTNDPAGEYIVEATGDGASNAFTITDGTDTIAYTVAWNNSAAPGSTSLTAGTPSSAFSGASAVYPCAADNANFRVRMTQTNLLSVPAGEYTGTLTIVVSPNDD